MEWAILPHKARCRLLWRGKPTGRIIVSEDGLFVSGHR
jgi:hypothetical protein